MCELSDTRKYPEYFIVGLEAIHVCLIKVYIQNGDGKLMTHIIINQTEEYYNILEVLEDLMEDAATTWFPCCLSWRGLFVLAH